MVGKDDVFPKVSDWLYVSGALLVLIIAAACVTIFIFFKVQGYNQYHIELCYSVDTHECVEDCDTIGMNFEESQHHVTLLRGCGLTDRCCEPLSLILKVTQSLTELDLSWNPLGHSGLQLICDGLKNENCKVQKLTVRKCGITADCSKELYLVLKANQSLRELDLSSNLLGDEGVSDIFRALKEESCKIEKLVPTASDT
nr:PREDICTED: ribonuclease inhibitor-like [Latimeria chalumnae]|eukprot:XP_014353044.1 PREDICTED: ribonuclease inhibitor-like [Latimeria chalumnae]